MSNVVLEEEYPEIACSRTMDQQQSNLSNCLIWKTPIDFASSPSLTITSQMVNIKKLL